MKPFNRVGGLHPGRSVFDLSYQKLFTCDMGQLIPIMCEEMIPGDKFEVGNDIVIRFQPLVAPVLHEINAYVHYFFVPTRLMFDNWSNFITGGIDGNDTSALPRFIPSIPAHNSIGSLWDYFGFPVGVNPVGAYPLSFPWRAYNMVYNHYYRDETLIPEVGVDSYAVLNRAWEKDYFTSALPWQQRGTAPALPISGSTQAVFHGAVEQGNTANALFYHYAAGSPGTHVLQSDASVNPATDFRDVWLKNNSVDLSSATTFNVADLRLAFQIQKWMERNARGGVRYTEFLQSHFGVSPRDDRLQRPEYLGGSKSPVIISEVLQTSSTVSGSPQANMAGHGITVDRTYACKYTAQEFGVIIGIMSVMPRAVYTQGINRQWLRTSRYDYPFPEFANLSEQAITQAEVYATDGNAAENTKIFGYQGRFDELRYKPSMVCANLRTDMKYWTLARDFTSAPGLNSDFVTCNPSKRIFAVTTTPGLIVSVGNRIKAIRPIPVQSNPGLIDHN